MKKILRRIDYLWTIIYGVVILYGVIFMPELQLRGGYGLRILLILGAGLLIIVGIIRLKNVDFKEQEILDDYEKLYLNQKLSDEEIDSIMSKKYGEAYAAFLEEEDPDR